MRRSIFLPEGTASPFPTGQPIAVLHNAMERGSVLTGTAVRCDRYRDLHVRFGGYEGVIPHSQTVHPVISGADRDIAVLSLVGKQISFTVTGIEADEAGRPQITLSRRAAQEQAIHWLFQTVSVGSVLPAQVTHLADFGAFVDLGGGFISLVPLENLSFARALHPSERVHTGQEILVIVTGIDTEKHRFLLSHKELLGTWLQNAAWFSPGDTVTGVVRAIQDYGTFIELTPNLSGLAEHRDDLVPGDAVTVQIRSIRPESHRIKLQIIQKLDTAPLCSAPNYFITDGVVSDWVY